MRILEKQEKKLFDILNVYFEFIKYLITSEHWLLLETSFICFFLFVFFYLSYLHSYIE